MHDLADLLEQCLRIAGRASRPQDLGDEARVGGDAINQPLLDAGSDLLRICTIDEELHVPLCQTTIPRVRRASGRRPASPRCAGAAGSPRPSEGSLDRGGALTVEVIDVELLQDADEIAGEHVERQAGRKKQRERR